MLVYNIDVFYTLIALMGYLLGSIPSGLLLARLMGAGDLRQIGSGNIGATNALRTGNKLLAALTLLCDMLKGMLAVWFAYELNMQLAQDAYPYIPVFAGFAAVIGHIFPIWLGFRGGKGVATALGVIISLHPLTGLGCLVTWLVVARLSRYSSLAALMAAFNAPLFALAYDGILDYNSRALALPFAGLAILLIITHRANIRRLMRGEESTIKLKTA